jgi:hypothetical protein
MSRLRDGAQCDQCTVYICAGLCVSRWLAYLLLIVGLTALCISSSSMQQPILLLVTTRALVSLPRLPHQTNVPPFPRPLTWPLTMPGSTCTAITSCSRTSL